MKQNQLQSLIRITILTLTIFSLLAFSVSPSLAKPSKGNGGGEPPVIEEAILIFNDSAMCGTQPNCIVIFGENLHEDQEADVRLSGSDNLIIQEYGDMGMSLIVENPLTPADIGSFLLNVKTESGDVNFEVATVAVGPQGATGAKGDKGDKGDTGDTGPTGALILPSTYEVVQPCRDNNDGGCDTAPRVGVVQVSVSCNSGDPVAYGGCACEFLSDTCSIHSNFSWRAVGRGHHRCEFTGADNQLVEATISCYDLSE